DGGVGVLLDLGFHHLLFILADTSGLFSLLHLIVSFAAHVAHSDLLVLGVFAVQLGQILAALFGQRRDRNTQILAVDDRVQAQARRADRLFDRDHHTLVPDAD